MSPAALAKHRPHVVQKLEELGLRRSRPTRGLSDSDDERISAEWRAQGYAPDQEDEALERHGPPPFLVGTQGSKGPIGIYHASTDDDIPTPPKRPHVDVTSAQSRCCYMCGEVKYVDFVQTADGLTCEKCFNTILDSMRTSSESGSSKESAKSDAKSAPLLVGSASASNAHAPAISPASALPPASAPATGLAVKPDAAHTPSAVSDARPPNPPNVPSAVSEARPNNAPPKIPGQQPFDKAHKGDMANYDEEVMHAMMASLETTEPFPNKSIFENRRYVVDDRTTVTWQNRLRAQLKQGGGHVDERLSEFAFAYITDSEFLTTRLKAFKITWPHISILKSEWVRESLRSRCMLPIEKYEILEDPNPIEIEQIAARAHAQALEEQQSNALEGYRTELALQKERRTEQIFEKARLEIERQKASEAVAKGWESQEEDENERPCRALEGVYIIIDQRGMNEWRAHAVAEGIRLMGGRVADPEINRKVDYCVSDVYKADDNFLEPMQQKRPLMLTLYAKWIDDCVMNDGWVSPRRYVKIPPPLKASSGRSQPAMEPKPSSKPSGPTPAPSKPLEAAPPKPLEPAPPKPLEPAAPKPLETVPAKPLEPSKPSSTPSQPASEPSQAESTVKSTAMASISKTPFTGLRFAADISFTDSRRATIRRKSLAAGASWDHQIGADTTHLLVDGRLHAFRVRSFEPIFPKLKIVLAEWLVDSLTQKKPLPETGYLLFPPDNYDDIYDDPFASNPPSVMPPLSSPFPPRPNSIPTMGASEATGTGTGAPVSINSNAVASSTPKTELASSSSADRKQSEQAIRPEPAKQPVAANHGTKPCPWPKCTQFTSPETLKAHLFQHAQRSRPVFI
jgi:hypothetical protein